MNSQHLTDDRCLDYLTGELPVDERQSFEDHLGACSRCRQGLEEYRTLLRSEVPLITDKTFDNLTAGPLPWSLDRGLKRLYAAIERQSQTKVPSEHVKDRPKLFPVHLGLQLAVAASLILVIAMGISIYETGLKRNQAQSRVVRQLQRDDSSLREQLESLTRERDQIQATLKNRETLISGLRAQLKESAKQNEALEAGLQAAGQQAQEQTEEASSERSTLARKVADEQTLLAATEKKLDALEQAKTSDAVRVTSLENQIHSMSLALKDKDATIDEQRHFLASDRDIRDLMGARDLYIAEVYDVGGNGRRKKPYGRVFYTKGKSLIFYAYDLDQQPGIKNASTFQAWGLRGPDRRTALNLGVMYIDNSTNRRWVLRFDNPKALKEINAVFVTVEPNGGSPVPRGKQVLFAYLGEEPNHP
jgi:anti-sigma factor RsiW